MSSAIKMLSKVEGGLFNQIAMFSVAGLSMSLALVFVGDLQLAYSWG